MMREPDEVKTEFFDNLSMKQSSESISRVAFGPVNPVDADPASQSLASIFGSEVIVDEDDDEGKVELFEFEQSALFHDQ